MLGSDQFTKSKLYKKQLPKARDHFTPKTRKTNWPDPAFELKARGFLSIVVLKYPGERN